MVPARHTSKIMLFAVVSLFMTGVLSSCSRNPAQSELFDDYTSVSAARVGTGSIQNIAEYPGIVKANEEAYIASALPGKVSQVFFEIGDRVKEGDVLFTIKSTEIEDSIKILEEQLKVARYNVDMAQNGVISAWGSQYESQKIQVEGALRSAENAYIAAKNNYDEYSLLFKTGKIGKQQLNEVKSRYDQASISLNSARNSYDLYINEISRDNKENASDLLNQAKASYAVIEQQLENTKKKLAQTKIESPIKGIVSARNILKGSLVSPETAAYTIIDPDPVLIFVSVTEQVVNKVIKGDELSVEIPSASQKPYIGHVSFVSPSVDKSLTYLIGIEVKNPDGNIKPGMSARVRIITDFRDSALIIPLSSVITNDGDTYVFTYESGTAVKKEIMTGMSDSRNVEVLNGLEKGDIIIIKGQQYLKDQDKVRIIGKEGRT